MSELRFETWPMPAAALGPDNPLPAFDTPRYQPFLSGKPAADPEAGYLPDYLPYTMQDGYTRARQMTPLRVAVLENALLRATFLLDYGGRLWSLWHKPTQRELLFVNPILQPANLAMRNAWFSGGVEWNMGVISHTPFTCAPLFAARAATADGTPVLRLYEWERIRQAAYQLDAYLPDGSPLLYVRVRLVNPHDHALPMYWWSNIAVPERADVRVLVPAERTYRYALSVDDLQTVPVPIVDGLDITYTTRFPRAADYFFLIPEDRRPWITALDASGQGLIQVSTARLRGRKLFLWGTGAGGQRWQEWLNGPDQHYLEIQAGLAPTQLEYALMPPRAAWSWLEGYGLMQADAALVHGADWRAAVAAIETGLEHLAPQAAFEAEYARSLTWQDDPPQEVVHQGAGWGALEQQRRRAAGQPPFASAALDFGAVTDAAHTPWLTLLQTGRFPAAATDDLTGGLLVQPEWRALLEQAVQTDAAAGWEAWYHLGNMRWHAGDTTGALAAWEQSLARRVTAWALRNVAVAQRHAGHHAAAADALLRAHRLRPALLPLLVETARALLDAGRAAEWLALLADLPDALRPMGRIRLFEVEASLKTGDLARAGQVFAAGFEITDYREGEENLTALWFEYHAALLSQQTGQPIDAALRAQARQAYPLPRHYDFRMNPEA